MSLESGLSKTRVFSSVLLVLLLAGNLYFTVQYIEGNRQQAAQTEATALNESSRHQSAIFMKEFIDNVIGTKGTISFEDRVKLENDIIQIHDATLLAQWRDFVSSTDSKSAQPKAIKLMSLLADKML